MATDHLRDEDEVRIGVYVCHCGHNIAGVVDCETVANCAKELPDVFIARENLYICSERGQQEIKDDIEQFGLNRLVIGSCTPRLHENTFREMCREVGVNPYLLEIANIREQCSWVHTDQPEEATGKAKDLIEMAVSRVRRLKAQEEIKVPITKRTLIVGGGVAGIQAALDLADSGFHVYLVEKKPSIGGIMAQLDKTYPTMDCSI